MLVDHTTASAEVAKELAEACAEFGVGFVDAPVSGGQAGAENGQLTIMCGSDDEAFYELAKPVMAAYAKACSLMGTAGAGQLTKMVNQICIAGIVQGLAEGINFAMTAGLDPDAGHRRHPLRRGAELADGEPRRARWRAASSTSGSPSSGCARTSASCSTEAKRNGARLPVTALIDQFYAQVIARGGKRWDTSSLIHLLAND